MADVSIEVGELRKLERTLSLVDGDARLKAGQALRKAAFAIERGAKQRAPVDTGFLRNSIDTTISGHVLTEGGMTAEIGPGAAYGLFVELGTHRMAPQPFLGPAFDEVEPTFIAAIQQINPLEPGSGGSGA